jgi:hypothetical protein
MPVLRHAIAPRAAAQPDGGGGDGYGFLLVSDWGCTPSSPNSCVTQDAQRAVASSMGSYAQHAQGRGFDFVLNMGDSFYDDGLMTAADVDLAAKSFNDVYGAERALQVPWYSVLGNHDYRGDTSLVVGHQIGRLEFPGRYYDWYERVGTDTYMHIIALDTTVFTQANALCRSGPSGAVKRP